MDLQDLGIAQSVIQASHLFFSPFERRVEGASETMCTPTVLYAMFFERTST